LKTLAKLALVLLAIAVVFQSGLVKAAEYYFASGGEQAAAPATPEDVSGQGCSSCDSTACGDEGCRSCNSCCNQLGCEENCKRFGIIGFAGFDSFKGISERMYPSNFGAVSGLNTGVLFPGLEDYGFGWQTGVSYGVYDFDGGNRGDISSTQQQIFVTTGFYRKAKSDQRVSFGLVYDWVVNDHWGEFGVNSTLSQWRGQIEYALNGCNAIGVWGCVRDRFFSYEHTSGSMPIIFSLIDRPISQINMFWHHKFDAGADSNVWIGIPERVQLDWYDFPLDWTIGANVQVPLSKRLALYANASYSHPSERAGSLVSSIVSTYDVGMGVVWYFGGKAHSDAINGSCSSPYMPVANNSNFLVDQHYMIID
jgi:hypothetical protein